MLRPIFKIALQKLGISSYHSTRDQYGQDQPKSFIKMQSVAAKGTRVGTDNDSTRELATVERDGSSLGEDDGHDQPHGIRTLISIGNKDVELGRTSPETNQRAIFVKNETIIWSEVVRQ